MSYFRISTTGANVSLADLGYVVVDPASNLVLSNQFSVEDLQNSADLASAIVAGTLTAQVNLDGTWTSVVAANFTGDEIYAASANIYEIVTTVDNQRLVDGSDASTATQLHHHDARYYTETEIGAISGAGLLGVDDTAWVNIGPAADAQTTFDNIDALFNTAVTLDAAYDNDSDGIMDVDGVTKDLNLRSNDVNDILISRKLLTDEQNALQLDVSADELILGNIAVGGLNAIDVRIKRNIIIEGNMTVTGTVTDTTVNELNVTNANIRLRNDATAIAGADAAVIVERGTSGADANLRWNETSDRWMAGLEGSDETIALLERDEVVTGVYEFQGGASTEPSMYLTNKAAAPSTNLGSASQFPMSVIGGILAVYDKTNSRNKFLSVDRNRMQFSGRDSSENTNEYARAGLFTSNQGGPRLMRNATLIGISAQTNGTETWSARVRKNGSVTNLATLGMVGVAGNQDITLNVDFNAGDDIELYIDGTAVNRPTIVLEFAYRF